jgi:hypothetical protein
MLMSRTEGRAHMPFDPCLVIIGPNKKSFITVLIPIRALDCLYYTKTYLIGLPFMIFERS